MRTEIYRQVAAVLWLTLVLNWFVALLKITLGVATHCMVILADGLHSFSDGASNVIGLFAMHVAGRPADVSHPYGHQKYETFASLIIAFFLFVVALGILREAAFVLFRPRVPQVTPISFLLMGFTLLVNLFVVFYERSKGKALKSDFLISDSWHTLTDVFVTLSVFAALIGISLQWRVLDPLFSIMIASVIAVTAARILKHSSDVLCDRAVVDTALIEKIVRDVSGVRDCHEIRTRGRDNEIYVDLHVLVDPEMSVHDSHHLAHCVERDIRQGVAGVHDVVVHIEPETHGHEELEAKGGE